MSWSKFQEIVKDQEAWHIADHGVKKSGTWHNDQTTTTKNCYSSHGKLMQDFYISLFN